MRVLVHAVISLTTGKTLDTMTTHERRVILILASVYLTRMLGLFLLFPVLVLFVQNYQFPHYWMATSVIGLYGLTQSLMQIPVGWLSDRIGRKKVIIGALFLLALGSLIAGYSQTGWGLMLGRTLQGCGALSAVAMSILAEEISTANRIKAMSIIGMSIGGAFALAMLIAPILSGWFVGLKPVFLLTALLALVAAILVTHLPISGRRAKADLAIEKASAILTPHSYRQLVVGIFIVHASLSMVFLLIPNWLSRADIEISDQGWFYLICFAIAGPFIMRRVRLIRRHSSGADPNLVGNGAWWLLASFIAFAAQAYFQWTWWWWLLALMVLFFFAFTLMEAILPAVYMNGIDPARRGQKMGAFTTMQFMGGFFGAVLGGVLYDGANEIAAPLFVIAMVLLWTVWIGLRRPRYI